MRFVGVLMGKHIICLIDGTKVNAAYRGQGKAYSNVFELACMLQIKDRTPKGEPQLVFYRSGISSHPDSRSAFDLLTGNTIISQVVDQYVNICANYDFSAKTSRDKIYLFGFSRGAMAVRALASIISEFGLLKARDIHRLPEIIFAWENSDGRASLSNEIKLEYVDIEFVGIFDAVMGGVKQLPVFNPINFANHKLPAHCKRGIHLIALDEDRPHFGQKIWTGAWPRRIRGGRELTKSDFRSRSFRQIWMPGIHSDVGGTGNVFLGNVALISMVYFIRRLTDLGIDKEWLEDREWRVRYAVGDKKFRISSNTVTLPYRRNVPNEESYNQFYHPICNLIKICRYKRRKVQYEWKEKFFDGIEYLIGRRDDLLFKYFISIT